MATFRPFFAVAYVLIGIAAVPPAHSADFRVQNAIYLDGDAKPQSQGVTIFHDGLVYDFLTEPSEIMVFDKPHSRFVLLDLTRRVQSERSTDDVKAFIDRAKKYLTGQKNPELRWLAEPTFDVTYDSPTSELTLRSEWLTYQVVLLPTGPEVAAEYREFSDWYTQFNHVLNPHLRPPFARMVLDAAMERNHGIAKEVRLTTNFSKSSTPTKITSRHELAGQLDASDMKRIAEASEAMRSFQRVSLTEYVQRK